MKAYVLIQTAAHDKSIATALRALQGVESAENLRGPYDAIALTRPGSTRTMLEEVVAQIRSLPGVMRALPAVSMNSLPDRSETRPSRNEDEAA